MSSPLLSCTLRCVLSPPFFSQSLLFSDGLFSSWCVQRVLRPTHSLWPVVVTKSLSSCLLSFDNANMSHIDLCYFHLISFHCCVLEQWTAFYSASLGLHSVHRQWFRERKIWEDVVFVLGRNSCKYDNIRVYKSALCCNKTKSN